LTVQQPQQRMSLLGLNCGCSFLSACSPLLSANVPTERQPTTPPLYELGSLVPLHWSGAHGGGLALSDIYTLDAQRLGKGSYGEVTGATHKETGARRAVKSVDKVILQKAKSDFMRREVDILRRLDHPNIVRLYEAFEEDNVIYLVLELCTGGDLLERVANSNEQMPERDAAMLTMQIIGAINHMHLHGVVHRDVKPENFLFTRREPEREPLPPQVSPLKLIDFGLSRRLSFESGIRMTPKIGTAEYMAPEAFAGLLDEALADRADMWSVGVVLHTMLTGHFPSPRLAKHAAQDYFTTPYWGRFSPECRDMLMQLLNCRPVQRPTANAAMRHPWLTLSMCNGEVDLIRGCHGIPEAVRIFSSFPSLRRLVMVAAAREVDDCDVLTLRRLFQRLELDCDGAITREALHRATCNDSPIGAIATALLHDFEAVDAGASGTIDWTEMVAAALCTTPSAVAKAKGIAGNGADAEGACFRAFELLKHGSGTVSCDSRGRTAWGAPEESRQWFVM